MVTNACYNLINGFNKYNQIAQMNNPKELFNPLLTNCFSGLLLFEKNISEDANNIIVLGDNPSIGHAAGEYIGSDDTQGNLNKAESGTINEGKGYRYVWDFPTNKANGTIRSVALTSGKGGHAGLSTSIERDDCIVISSAQKSLKNANEVITLNSRILTNVDGSFIGATKDNTFIFAKGQPGESTVIFKTQHYANVMTLNNNSAISNNEKTVTSNLKLCGKDRFQQVGDKIYSLYAYDANKLDVVVFDIKNFGIVSEDSYVIQDARFRSTSSDSLYRYSPIYHDGDFFLFGGQSTDSGNYVETVYRINASDVADYEHYELTMNTGTNYYYGAKLIVIGDTVLCISTQNTYYKSASRVYGFDGSHFRYIGTFSGVTNYASNGISIGDITFINSDALALPYLMGNYQGSSVIYFFIWTPFLSTINNLSTPVVKNETQTMKVTYEITEI